MVLNYFLAIIFFLCISFPTVIFATICSRTKIRAGGVPYEEYFCCRHFREKNGECEACPNGYISYEQTQICEPCPSGRYGARCTEQCECQAKESCDNERGCVVTVQPTASMLSTKPTLTSKEKANNNDSTKPTLTSKEKANNNDNTDIGFYMMCIVVILLVAIIFVIVWQS